MKNLKRILVNYNCIKSWPELQKENNYELLKKSLLEINISHNYLKSIPNDISELKSLSSLILSYNAITYFPSSVLRNIWTC